MTLQQGRTGLRCAKIGRHSEGCDSYGVQTSRLSRELFPLDRSSCLRQRAFRNSALTFDHRCALLRALRATVARFKCGGTPVCQSLYRGRALAARQSFIQPHWTQDRHNVIKQPLVKKR